MFFFFQGTVVTVDTYEGLQKSAYDFANCLQSPEKSSVDPVGDTTNIPSERDDDSDRNSLVDRQVAKDLSCYGQNKDREDPVEPIEVAENSSTGNVSSRVYLSYILGGGRTPKLIFFISVCVLTQVLASAGDLWVAYW